MLGKGFGYERIGRGEVIQQGKLEVELEGNKGLLTTVSLVFGDGIV